MSFSDVIYDGSQIIIIDDHNLEEDKFDKIMWNILQLPVQHILY